MMSTTKDENFTKDLITTDNHPAPQELPILPTQNQIAFPTVHMSFAVQSESRALLDAALKSGRLIGILGISNSKDDLPIQEQTYGVGTMVRVIYVTRASEDTTVVVAEGLKRFRIAQWLSEEPFLKARITLIPELIETDLETEALFRNLRTLTKEVFTLSMTTPGEALEGLEKIKDPIHLAYVAAAYSDIDFEKRQKILEIDSLKQKIGEMVALMSHEKEVLTLGKKIQNDARDEMNKSQRDYYLRQQLKAIKKELGDSGEETSEAAEFRQRIENSDMSVEARAEALKELDRFAAMSPQSPEHSMVRNYLDWLLDLPWGNFSRDQTDIIAARNILDADHYGLQEVKDRIIEFLSVRNLLNVRRLKPSADTTSPELRGNGVILCFAGPPGVGKTSLGQSIARAMGREFTRMSLGGIRDEAEIRGHRRTYVGAMPGRIIQSIKRAGTRNPVFMLDEVDKLGSDWRGDTSSALLEVLDPAQNAAFRDHYLDVDFDLSEVMFIATANQLETIPAPLRDRMEIIQIDGYTENEKLQIAKNHLILRQVKEHGLDVDDIMFIDEAVCKIINNYTRESGVRQLERLLGAICRKCVVHLTTNGWSHMIVTPDHVADFLKKEKFESEISESIDLPGVATGLAVTPTGGDILFVEATQMHGSGKLKLTGQLGDVMRESAQLAYSYIRAQAQRLAIEPKCFDRSDVHLHVPAGAIPKDGPSAGIAMIMALASLFSNRTVRGDVGMTGEVTLRGRVLPVGGIKMKVLAAHRAGLKTVILPERNARDLADIPDDIRKKMQFIFVDRIDEALDAGLFPAGHDSDTDAETNSGLHSIRENVLAMVDSPIH
ncbi:MAG: endopeptidase La [Desulfobacterales bacterium]|jgi:ATP-dependent Lon protease